MGGWVQQVYETPGDFVWVCPAGVFCAIVYGCGGGGGGGLGASGTGATGQSPPGGGGGGAAIESMGFIETVPGTSYTLTVGAGGIGAVYSPGVQVDGGNGGSSYIWPTAGGRAQRLVSFNGAQGGNGAFAVNLYPTGGKPTKWGSAIQNGYHNMPGLGGYGSWATSGFDGAPGKRAPGSTATVNSTGGTNGAVSGSYRGGGGGGGGGVGQPLLNGTGGLGGTGGSGGGGNSGGFGSNGTAGGAGTGIGSGGGGSGGAGNGSSGGGLAQNGGAGAGGRLILIYYLG